MIIGHKFQPLATELPKQLFPKMINPVKKIVRNAKLFHHNSATFRKIYH